MKHTKYIYTIIGFYIFPILFLYQNNFANVTSYQIILPIAISILSSGVFYFFLKLLAKYFKVIQNNFNLIFFISSSIFLYYGHLHKYLYPLKSFNFLGVNIHVGSHRILLVLIFFVALFFILFLKKYFKDSQVKEFVFIFISVLIFQQLIFLQFSNSNRKELNYSNENLFETNKYPDIYYIILDAYASEYTLKKEFNFNNYDFYDFLKINGFVTPEVSRSNYPFTRFSLPSSLNLNFLDSLNCLENEDLYSKISYNYASQFLKSKGYTYIYFNTGYGFKSPNKNEIAISKKSIIENTSDNSFLNLFFETTLLKLIYDKISFIENDYYRDKILYALDKLNSLPQIDKSKFVFLHLILPHPPYLFRSDGSVQNEFAQQSDTIQLKKNYIEQLRFANERIKNSIKNIIKTSRKPPIIILQSDHGITYEHQISRNDVLGIKSRFYILNSIYAPKEISSKFYTGISPVNTFRIIFNELFNSRMTLLKDKSFLVTDMPPFKYTEVSDLLDTNRTKN